MGNYYCKNCGVPHGYHHNIRANCRHSEGYGMGYHEYRYKSVITCIFNKRKG